MRGRLALVATLCLVAAALPGACGGNDSSTSQSTGGGHPTSSASGTGGAGGSGGTGTTTTTPGSGGAGGGTAGGGTAGGGGTGGSSGVCPADPPDQNTTCPTPDVWCSWGTDDRFGCRIVSHCKPNHKWERFPISGIINCPSPEPTCPTDFTGDCTDDAGLICVDAMDQAYVCASCNGNLCFQNPQWITDGNMLDPACPKLKLPNFGEPCTDEGLECDYDHCADHQGPGPNYAHGIDLSCTNGVWTMGTPMTFCP